MPGRAFLRRGVAFGAMAFRGVRVPDGIYQPDGVKVVPAHRVRPLSGAMELAPVATGAKIEV